MASQIEKMNKMRRNILLGVLIGVVIMFGWFMLPTFFIKFRFRLFDTALKGAGITGLLILFIFGTRYWIYKNSLKKDSTLRAAVNDERIKLNWLKAYRFSFYIIICITIFLKLWDMLLLAPALLDSRIFLPHDPWLILFSAVISLVGAFLYYNREAQDG